MVRDILKYYLADLETQVETAQTQMRGHDHVDHSTHGKDVNPPTQRPHRRAATMSSVENTEDSACPCEAEVNIHETTSRHEIS